MLSLLLVLACLLHLYPCAAFSSGDFVLRGNAAVGEPVKYFHEPGENDDLRHYDSRYFRGVVSDDKRQKLLKEMIRAYLTAFNDMGLETWIAHGTLLGWWWNCKILPWDRDLDTQVSVATLAHMAVHLNHTVHQFSTSDQERREYLLDVNPWQKERHHGDGANVIDARWIDMDTGLFVDITALTAVSTVPPRLVMDKNGHSYQIPQLYPLRKSVFEGVWALIPNSYTVILEEEYSVEALTRTDFAGHQWDSNTGEWVKKKRQ